MPTSPCHRVGTPARRSSDGGSGATGGRLDDRVRRRPHESLYKIGNPSLPITHNQNIHAVATVAFKKTPRVYTGRVRQRNRRTVHRTVVLIT